MVARCKSVLLIFFSASSLLEVSAVAVKSIQSEIDAIRKSGAALHARADNSTSDQGSSLFQSNFTVLKASLAVQANGTRSDRDDHGEPFNPKSTEAAQSATSLLASAVDSELGILRPKDKAIGKTAANKWHVMQGILVLMVAVTLQWLNERRSVRLDVLRTRGLAECVSISGEDASKESFVEGRLVHAQGRTVTTAPLVDAQFQDVQLKNCLKIQSNVEVFQHVPLLGQPWPSKNLPAFGTEWMAYHDNLKDFKRPLGEMPQPPVNPEPPHGLILGGVTRIARDVRVEDHVLPQDLVQQFKKYVPAIGRPDMPDTVTFRTTRPQSGVVLKSSRNSQNTGYYYSRPSKQDTPETDIISNPQVGDLRVRFLCVPESDATVVAVQHSQSGVQSFVPYRPITRGLCTTEEEAQKRLVQEGQLSLKDFLEQDVCCLTPKGDALVPCCMCCYPCTTLACCCGQEVVTEEVMFMSDRLEGNEAAFQDIVPRNRCRVLCYRVLIWLLMYWALRYILSPSSTVLATALDLGIYGMNGNRVLVVGATFALSSLVAAVSYAYYLPSMAFRYLLLAVVIMAAPKLVT